jgi:hypothetical protein
VTDELKEIAEGLLKEIRSLKRHDANYDDVVQLTKIKIALWQYFDTFVDYQTISDEYDEINEMIHAYAREVDEAIYEKRKAKVKQKHIDYLKGLIK